MARTPRPPPATPKRPRKRRTPRSSARLRWTTRSTCPRATTPTRPRARSWAATTPRRWRASTRPWTRPARRRSRSWPVRAPAPLPFFAYPSRRLRRDRDAGLATHAPCGLSARPCDSSCALVGSTCPAEVLTALGVTCSADATCTAGVDIDVGAVDESYGGAACAGLVANVAVPPGPLVDPLLAPLQPPLMVQALIEDRVQGIFDKIPPWAPVACQRAARAAVCAQHVAIPVASATQVLPAIAGALRRLLLFAAILTHRSRRPRDLRRLPPRVRRHAPPGRLVP